MPVMAELTRRLAMKDWPTLLALGAALMSVAVTPGCVGIVAAGGATAASASAQERGIGGALSDTAIRARINDLWFTHDESLFTAVSLSVVEGRVLLTGSVKSEAARVDAVRLAWQADGVKEVINEIRVADSESVGSYARDTWISTKLKAKLLLDENVSALNYSIETVEGTVYLMGVARSEAELERVKNQARDVPYVRRVVSYVMLKNDPRRKRK